MNYDMLRKNVGSHIQLEPLAIHLDPLGRELPSQNEDWVIQYVKETEIGLREAKDGALATTIGKDHVHNYATNPSRSIAGGLQYGFLKLDVQLFIQNGAITYRLCPRPGARVDPPPVKIVDKSVEFNYPTLSGIQPRLEAAGYRVSWVLESRVSTLEIQGWEIVIEPDQHGMPTRFHVQSKPENMALVKTSQPDLAVLASSPIWRNNVGFVSCTVSPNGRELIFSFTGATEAIAFKLKMDRDRSVIRCAMMPGRVDTIIGTLTDHGADILKSQPS